MAPTDSTSNAENQTHLVVESGNTKDDDLKTTAKEETTEPATVVDVEKQTLQSDGSEHENGNDKAQESEPESPLKSFANSLVKFFWKYQFPIMIISAIMVARVYPPLGARYLKPKITATWLAVGIMFLISGMGLRTEELSQAFKRIFFNCFVQSFNFFVVSGVVYTTAKSLTAANILDEALAHGMIICGSLPMAINIIIVFSGATGADEGAAIFNTTFSNILGIFLSPVLILLYLGETGDISLGRVFFKLTLRVILPLVVGQLIQNFWESARNFFKQHRRRFKKVQELCLVFIVYSVFCRTFEADAGSGIADVFIMIGVQFILMNVLAVTGWYSLKLFYPNEPELRVMGALGCVMKTVALGIPLITSIYEDDPNEGLYSLSILIWHPMQLVLGSMLLPRFTAFIATERKRIDDNEEKLQSTNRSDNQEENDCEAETKEEKMDDGAVGNP